MKKIILMCLFILFGCGEKDLDDKRSASSVSGDIQSLVGIYELKEGRQWYKAIDIRENGVINALFRGRVSSGSWEVADNKICIQGGRNFQEDLGEIDVNGRYECLDYKITEDEIVIFYDDWKILRKIQ